MPNRTASIQTRVIDWHILLIYSKSPDKSKPNRAWTHTAMFTSNTFYGEQPLKCLFSFTTISEPSTYIKALFRVNQNDPLTTILEIWFLAKTFRDISLERFEFKIKFYHRKFVSPALWLIDYGVIAFSRTIETEKISEKCCIYKNQKHERIYRERK